MHRATIPVTPTTSVSAAAQLLVERGLNCLPVVLASELHIQVRSVLAAPLEGGVPRVATVRLGTIHPAPLLVRLQEAHIQYIVGDPKPESESHA